MSETNSYSLETRNWLLKVFKYAEYLSAQDLKWRNCPACNGKEYTHFANNNYLDYSQCCNCTHVFMNPTIDKDKIQKGFNGDDPIVMEYFEIVNKYRKKQQPLPDPDTDNKLYDIYALKKTGKLLDVGCAYGDFLSKAEYFYDVEGVEVNPITANEAAKQFIIHRGYLDELELEKVYDIVTLHQILYGVSDPLSLLREIHEILKDDGIVYINTPNANSYAMQLYKGRCNHLYGYTNQNVFSRSSLEKAAELTGFKIKSFRTEWLDIYVTDILLFLDKPEAFIHKQNPQFEGYESRINIEEEMHKRLDYKLGERGNYLVAVLEKV